MVKGPILRQISRVQQRQGTFCPARQVRPSHSVQRGPTSNRAPRRCARSRAC